MVGNENYVFFSLGRLGVFLKGLSSLHCFLEVETCTIFSSTRIPFLSSLVPYFSHLSTLFPKKKMVALPFKMFFFFKNWTFVESNKKSD